MIMPHLYEDTINCKASFYLDEDGHEMERDEFIRRMRSMHGVMLYVGGGFVKLQVAVLTFSQHDWDSPTSAFEEWARNTGRHDEIGEDEEYQAKVKIDPDNTYPEYELHIENIPSKQEVSNPFDETYRELHVHEQFNGFYITHNPTNTTRGMGDGTDRDYPEGMVKAEYADLMYAYFSDIPDLRDLEIHALEYMEANDFTGKQIAREVAEAHGWDPKKDINKDAYVKAVMKQIAEQEDAYKHLLKELETKSEGG
jgi:hypothetical protein